MERNAKRGERMQTISLIVPVFNTEKYLRECLDSIFLQTYPNVEVIIVNDGSTDRSQEIINEYHRHHSNMVVIRQENLGLSMARNAGLKKAGGDYVTFVDSDDIIHPYFLELLQKVIQKNNADIAYTSLKRFKKSPVIFHKKHSLHYRKYVCDSRKAVKYYLHNIAGNVCGGLFKRNLFEGIYFPEHLIYEDNLPKLQLLLKAKCTVFTNTDLYYYRHTRNSITNQKFNEKKFDIAIIGYRMEGVLKEKEGRDFPYYKEELYRLNYIMLYDVFREALESECMDFSKLYDEVPLTFLLKILLIGCIRDKEHYGLLCQWLIPKLMAAYAFKKFI